MKVLFVASGNNGLSVIIKNQASSLIQQGILIDFYCIKGCGFFGYLLNVFHLKKKINSNYYDLIHAHYGLSAICASLTFTKIPIVVSLMGSDLFLGKIWIMITRSLAKFYWKATIVKSDKMKTDSKIKEAYIIPNGVNISKFKPLNKRLAKMRVGFKEKKNIIFLGDPTRPEKNYVLAKNAMEILKNENCHLHVIYGINQSSLIYYYNAADALLLTSLWEGSPNVIKEAMACNLPIVTTKVGDVPEIIENTKGCYICKFVAIDVSNKIKSAVSFGKRSNGRSKIIELGLDSDSIANRIVNVYNSILN